LDDDKNNKKEFSKVFFVWNAILFSLAFPVEKKSLAFLSVQAATFLAALKPLLPSGPLGCLTTTILRPPLAASSRFIVFSFEISLSGLLVELQERGHD
jgi:hypothetical protein